MFSQGSRNEYTVQQPFAWLKKAILVVAIAGFIAVIWYAAANRDNLKSEELNPTLVQAPKSPIKERPDAPGGMEVPHRDKKVFNLLEGEDEATAPEPAPEATAKTAISTTEAEAEPQTEAAPEPEKKAPEPVAETTKEPASAPAAEQAKGWAVQLGSFRSRSDAEKAIDIFRKKFSTMLEGLSPAIREVQLSQGTFYRVSFVGLESNEAARNLCSAFKQRNQGCLNVNLK